MKTEEIINKQLSTNPIIIYMKGVPDNPECGFSAKSVEILNATKIPYAFVNVLQSPFIREKLPKVSNWPTYPQLFVNGELIGGCDIIEAMHNDGTLLPELEKAVPANTASNDSSLTTREVEQMVVKGIPGAKVYIEGEGCDLVITVISEEFSDLVAVKKQQRVLAQLKDPLATGKLHAVSVKAYTPEEWQCQQKNDSGLLQIQS